MIERLDHLVLTVHDVEATCAFYTDVLEMEIVTFGDGRRALRFGQQKLNLHQAGREFEPKAALPTPGSADLCFLTSVPLSDIAVRLRSRLIPILAGPILRTGALGPIHSLYFRDPDGNLLEVSRSAEE